VLLLIRFQLEVEEMLAQTKEILAEEEAKELDHH
jgi:hypothetical protein